MWRNRRQYKGGQPESGEHSNALVEKVLILTPTHSEARHEHCLSYDHATILVGRNPKRGSLRLEPSVLD